MLCICDTKPPLLGRSRDNPLGRRATTADPGIVWRGFSYVGTLVDGLYQYVRSEDESIASIHSGSSAGLGGLGGLGGFGVGFGVGFGGTGGIVGARGFVRPLAVEAALLGDQLELGEDCSAKAACAVYNH